MHDYQHSFVVDGEEVLVWDFQKVVIDQLQAQELDDGRYQLVLDEDSLIRAGEDFFINFRYEYDGLIPFFRLGFKIEEDRSVNFLTIEDWPYKLIGTYVFIYGDDFTTVSAITKVK